ncbi:glycerophosphodiester phosphodiesterase gdpd6 [Quercus suber]|uniref:glycerophosphodiester phosphodiesterase n=1 Tax=Quercus suber TaxID=58331 RepID=A0AAW0KKW3_QUESU
MMLINSPYKHLGHIYNIARRGSNAEFPEETAAAYMRAIEVGADFIETDILASKDGVLICSHDVTLDLDNRTNIANFSQFADRKRTYEIQGVNMTGWFVVDFTLEELKLLGVNQRFSFRDQQYNGKFPIITFKEYISIALDAKRVVGIYPKIKNLVFINKHVSDFPCVIIILGSKKIIPTQLIRFWCSYVSLLELDRDHVSSTVIISNLYITKS